MDSTISQGSLDGVAVLGVIGCGNMGGALIRSLVVSKTLAPKNIVVFDTDTVKLNALATVLGVTTVSSIAELVSLSNYVVLAVKPQVAAAVLREIAEEQDVDYDSQLAHRMEVDIERCGEADVTKTFISIAASLPTYYIECHLPLSWRVVRVMPNMPCLISQGVLGFWAEKDVNTERVEVLLSALGMPLRVSTEQELDAVTGLSGSGPAFVALFTEALADAGVKMGLSRELANKLAAYTVQGTGKLMIEAGMHPAIIKDMVASPSGTTIYGLHVLEERGVRGAVVSAVEAATLRARQLGRSYYE